MSRRKIGEVRTIADILREKNIILKGADAFSEKGFTQVTNAILRSKKISMGAKMTYAALLSYAWQSDFCFPGQQRLGDDIGVTRQTANEYIQELKTKGFVKITRKGQGRPNVYELKVRRGESCRAPDILFSEIPTTGCRLSRLPEVGFPDRNKTKRKRPRY